MHERVKSKKIKIKSSRPPRFFQKKGRSSSNFFYSALPMHAVVVQVAGVEWKCRKCIISITPYKNFNSTVLSCNFRYQARDYNIIAGDLPGFNYTCTPKITCLQYSIDSHRFLPYLSSQNYIPAYFTPAKLS